MSYTLTQHDMGSHYISLLQKYVKTAESRYLHQSTHSPVLLINNLSLYQQLYNLVAEQFYHPGEVCTIS